MQKIKNFFIKLLIAVFLVVTLFFVFVAISCITTKDWGALVISVSIIGILALIIYLLHSMLKKNTCVKDEAVNHPDHTENKPVQKPIHSSKSSLKVLTCNVAGTSFRQDAIKSLCTNIDNPAYYYTEKELLDECYESEKVYKDVFESKLVSIQPEPDNKYDPNALKVIIDDVHVGYIKKEQCASVQRLIDDSKIKSIVVDVRGGEYKYLSEKFEPGSDKNTYKLSSGTTDYFVTLKIKHE